MTHQDRTSWRTSIPGNLRRSSSGDTRKASSMLPFRDEDESPDDSDRTRQHLHRFFEALLRRSEQ